MDNRYEKQELIFSHQEVKVYKGLDRKTQEFVALKTIDNPKLYKKHRDHFEKEAYILQLFDDDYIERFVDLLDVGELTLVTEFAEGRPLNELIQEDALSFESKIIIAKHILLALDVVHQAGVIHKDLNPHNLIWNDGHLVILDFNISEHVTKQSLTLEGSKLQGTIQYLAPEQTGKTNNAIDYRTDFYSAGITLFELFTGQLPFKGYDYASTLHAHLAKYPALPNEINPEIPYKLTKIIMKLIAKNPEDRYQTIRGVLYDLDCLEDLESEVGIHDQRRFFSIPDRLYGREDLLSRFENQFSLAARGAFQHTFLSGYSGVGKTALVKAMQPYIVKHNGYFIWGKYDQNSLMEPFDAIKEIINGFLDNVKAEGPDHYQQWYDKMLETMKGYLGLVSQFMPNVVESDETIALVSGMELHNRYQLMLQKLIQSMTSMDRPLLIFLDDVQWIDGASIDLLRELFSEGQLQFVHFVCAYRSNEVKGNHPFQAFLHYLEAREIDAEVITLEGLSPEAISLMLEDAGICKDDVLELRDAILDKTAGNPFYFRVLLNDLKNTQCIQFSEEDNCLIVDQTCLDHITVSEEVADMLKNRMMSEDQQEKKVLAIASCIGFQFDVTSIDLLLGGDSRQALRLLVDKGYLNYLSSQRYQFVHDQVQRSAERLMDDKEKAKIHHRFALWLMSNEASNYVKIALHAGRALNVFEDKTPLVGLFLKSGQMAMASIAYDLAIEFLETGLSLLEDWNDYTLTLDYHNALVESSYAIGDYGRLDQYVGIMKKSVTQVIHLASAYEYEVQSLMGRQRYSDSLHQAMEGMKSIGMDIVLEVTPDQHMAAFEHLNDAMGQREIIDLLKLAPMMDKDQIASMKMLTAVLPLLFNTAPQLVPLITIEMVMRSLTYGNCQYSAFAYAFMGTLLCGVFGNYKDGETYGDIAVALIDQLNAVSEIPKVYMLVSQHIYQFTRSLEEVLSMEEIAYRTGLETGDLTYAGFAGHGYSYNYYFAGKPLGKVRDVFIRYTDALMSIKQGTQTLFQNIYLETLENLIHHKEDPLHFEGKWFSERDFETMVKNNHRTGLFVYYFNKVELAYIFGHFQEGMVLSEAFRKHLDGGLALMQGLIFYQYDSLFRLALYDDLSPSQQAESMAIVEANQHKLHPLNQTINYGHRYKIVEAEIARVEGRSEDARHLYEKAIEMVETHKHLRESGIYRECFSRFYSTIEYHELSSYYLNTAFDSYRVWGAKAKANKLSHMKNQTSSRLQNTVHTVTAFSVDKDSVFSMNIESLVKITSAVSKELKLHELTKTLLDVLIEYAGASKAVLVSFLKDDNVIVARNCIEGNYKFKVVETIHDYRDYPLSIINYSLSDLKVVKLDYVEDSPLFRSDAYFDINPVESLMVYPIMNAGKCIGLVYLENNVSRGAFNGQGVNLMRILSSQISTSLENALMYEQLESLVKDRTKDLEDKNNELLALNYKLHQSSITDELTGLYNRRKLNDVLNVEMQKAKRYKHPFSVMLMDVDHFKQVNDKYGHHIGDQVLMEIASLMEDKLRNVDVIGRWGGEEFLVICTQTDVKQCVIAAEKLRSAIASYHFDQVGKITCSFGVAQYEESDKISQLLTKVDDRLYSAKNQGRNQVKY